MSMDFSSKCNTFCMSDLQTKTCSKCLEVKILSEFVMRTRVKSGFGGHCKACHRESALKWHHQNKEQVSKYKKSRRSISNEQLKKRYASDPEYVTRVLKLNKKWRENNKEHISEKNKQYRSAPENREKIRESQKNLDKKYRKERPEYRILKSLRGRMRNALNGRSKAETSINLLGCPIGTLKTYLESKWKAGMSWENYGFLGWHIDHIKPCSSFDLLDPEQQKVCFHYTNLQPLWAHENFSKSSKIPDAF